MMLVNLKDCLAHPGRLFMRFNSPPQVEHSPHTDDKYGPFEPSSRPRGHPGGRQTTWRLNQAGAEIISLDGAQVALHLASSARYGWKRLEGGQGGEGAGLHTGRSFRSVALPCRTSPMKNCHIVLLKPRETLNYEKSE